MRRSIRRTVQSGCLSLLALSAAGEPAFAQSRQAMVQQLQRVHSELLESDTARHLESRRRESDAIERMVELGRDLDRAFEDPETPLAELRDLEITLADAREEAFNRVRESAELRADIYARRELLSELARELDALRAARPLPDPLTGRWRFESTTRPTRNSAAPLPARRRSRDSSSSSSRGRS